MTTFGATTTAPITIPGADADPDAATATPSTPDCEEGQEDCEGGEAMAFDDCEQPAGADPTAPVLPGEDVRCHLPPCFFTILIFNLSPSSPPPLCTAFVFLFFSLLSFIQFTATFLLGVAQINASVQSCIISASVPIAQRHRQHRQSAVTVNEQHVSDSQFSSHCSF
ncbi:hypothetical protein INR49_000728 [Caranx melampygus]|nr:hypothetical protein INR49_000728 [Caranx melampygus]